MGGLMASAAGALSNGETARTSTEHAGAGSSVSRADTSSMAEWQISQAEQVLEWWSCAVQPEAALSQAECAACMPWWLE